MRRVFFRKYDSSGRFPDGRAKLDVFFRDSEGNEYVWTPEWERGTRQLFLEAYRIERLNTPASPERQRFRRVAEQVLDEEREERTDLPQVNYKLLATRLGESLKNSTTLNEIDRIGLAIFDFEVSPHPHPAITSSRSHRIYEWVMTLADEPITEQRRQQLLRDFIGFLTSPDSAERKLLDEFGVPS